MPPLCRGEHRAGVLILGGWDGRLERDHDHRAVVFGGDDKPPGHFV